MDTNYLQPVFEEFKTYYEKANDKYDFNKKDIGEKNVLKLMKYLGEFVSETKACDYENSKKMDKEDAVEELSKCILITFNFLYQLNEKLENITGEQNFGVVEQFLYVMNETSFLIYDFESARVKNILANILKISKTLKLPEDDILNACYFQIEKMLKSV